MNRKCLENPSSKMDYQIYVGNGLFSARKLYFFNHDA